MLDADSRGETVLVEQGFSMIWDAVVWLEKRNLVDCRVFFFCGSLVGKTI